MLKQIIKTNTVLGITYRVSIQMSPVPCNHAVYLCASTDVVTEAIHGKPEILQCSQTLVELECTDVK
jgi:hypothetical protein